MKPDTLYSNMLDQLNAIHMTPTDRMRVEWHMRTALHLVELVFGSSDAAPCEPGKPDVAPAAEEAPVRRAA